MIIQVASELRIVGDGRCWGVERLVPSVKGKEPRWENIGWHGWLSIAFKSILERHVQLLDGFSDEIALREVVDVICCAAVQLEDACEQAAKQMGMGSRFGVIPLGEVEQKPEGGDPLSQEQADGATAEG